MAKQQIVLQINTYCDGSRTKAKKIASKISGVQSADIVVEGDGKDRLVVVGDGIDAATLVSTLLKGFKYTKLVSMVDIEAEERVKEIEALKRKLKEGEKEAERLRGERDAQKARADTEAQRRKKAEAALANLIESGNKNKGIITTGHSSSVTKPGGNSQASALMLPPLLTGYEMSVLIQYRAPKNSNNW